MTIPVYLWLTDGSGNPVKGSVEGYRREGSIEITALAHDVSLPVDDASGQVTATREHAPFILTKALDASSPHLYQFVSSGKRLKSAELRFYRINYAGQEEEYFNIFLNNVHLSCLVPFLEDIKNKDFEQHEHLEVFEMTYEKITWRYVDGNIIYCDSWNKQSGA